MSNCLVENRVIFVWHGRPGHVLQGHPGPAGTVETTVRLTGRMPVPLVFNKAMSNLKYRLQITKNHSCAAVSEGVSFLRLNSSSAADGF